MKRRDLIRGGIFVGAGGLVGAAAMRSADGPAAPTRARNIIFLAYDGMSWEDVALAQFYSRRHAGRPLLLHDVLKRGRSGSQETYSLSSVVTDSAAAASAWSTGRKQVNYRINQYPDGTRLTPIFDVARGRGMATGLVTTTRVTHATPAAFLASVPNRSREDDIAAQYFEFGPDVLLGGGARHFLADRRADGRNLLRDFAATGYGIVRNAAQLQRTNASRLLGLFSDDHVPFEIDRRADSTHPTLSQMARHALRVLSGAERGFVLQVEAGRIDHANHKSDAAASLHESLEADRTLRVLVDFVDAHPHTLLILASDHGTGGISVYGLGSHYRESSGAVQRIEAHNASFDRMLALLGRSPEQADVADVVRRHTGVTLTATQAGIVAAAIRDGVSGGNAQAFRDQPHNTLGYVLYGGGEATRRDRASVNFSTGQHTAGLVPVAVYGAGADGIRTGVVDNTEIFGWMTDALGESVRNPIMSEREALEALADGSSPEPDSPRAPVIHD